MSACKNEVERRPVEQAAHPEQRLTKASCHGCSTGRMLVGLLCQAAGDVEPDAVVNAPGECPVREAIAERANQWRTEACPDQVDDQIENRCCGRPFPGRRQTIDGSKCRSEIGVNAKRSHHHSSNCYIRAGAKRSRHQQRCPSHCGCRWKPCQPGLRSGRQTIAQLPSQQRSQPGRQAVNQPGDETRLRHRQMMLALQERSEKGCDTITYQDN